MSLRKPYTDYPDTLRTFEANTEKYRQTETIFLTPSTFTMTPEQFADVDYFYTQLGTNIFPIHNASEFTPQDEATQYGESLQGFTYKQFDGKYRHKIKYNFSLDYHKLINDFSGQKLNVIYASGNVLRACQPSEGIIRGFTISALELEKLMFSTYGSVGNSDLFIELDDSDELNVYGYEVEVDWLPSQVDRLMLNISLSYSTDVINMRVRYLDNPIENIVGSDITITDQLNGNINFALTNLSNGYYNLYNFDNQINNGCISILSTIYFGNKKYNYVVVISLVNNWLLLTGDNFTTLSGDNFTFLN